jgi:hypothetical protein
MAQDKATFFHWELAGAISIFLSGGLLHFLFEWSGGWAPVALIAAVNESVWEHLKMVFWPGLIFALVSYPFLRGRSENFWTAKIAGLLSMPLVILALFYAYKLVFKTHNLAYDIAIFILAVALGQWIGFSLLQRSRPPRYARLILIAGLLVALTAFSLFSYFPPKYPLFQDSHTGDYGLPRTELRR